MILPNVIYDLILTFCPLNNKYVTKICDDIYQYALTVDSYQGCFYIDIIYRHSYFCLPRMVHANIDLKQTFYVEEKGRAFQWYKEVIDRMCIEDHIYSINQFPEFCFMEAYFVLNLKERDVNVIKKKMIKDLRIKRNKKAMELIEGFFNSDYPFLPSALV